MKTSEFKTALEQYQLKVDQNDSEYIKIYTPDKKTSGYVSNLDQYKLDLDYGYSIANFVFANKRLELWNIVTEYAATPISERKDEKKYLLLLVGTEDDDGGKVQYVGYSNEFNNPWYASTVHAKSYVLADGAIYNYQFTEKQVNEAPVWVKACWEDRILVEKIND